MTVGVVKAYELGPRSMHIRWSEHAY